MEESQSKNSLPQPRRRRAISGAEVILLVLVVIVGMGMWIWVERESQKGIVVGRGGTMVRDIGTAARAELERELDRRIHLDLHVKVKADWRNNERLLDEIAAQNREES